MEVLWRTEKIATEDIVAALHKPNWQEATIKTLLNRLLNKRAISAQKDGRRYLYSAVLKRDEWVSSEAEGFLGRLFDGRVAPLVAHFSRHRKLTKKDVADLKRGGNSTMIVDLVMALIKVTGVGSSEIPIIATLRRPLRHLTGARTAYWLWLLTACECDCSAFPGFSSSPNTVQNLLRQPGMDTVSRVLSGVVISVNRVGVCKGSMRHLNLAGFAEIKTLVSLRRLAVTRTPETGRARRESQCRPADSWESVPGISLSRLLPRAAPNSGQCIGARRRQTPDAG